MSVVFRLEEMLAGKAEEVRKRVRVIYGDLRAAINDQVTAHSATQRLILTTCLQLARDIGPVQFILHLAAGANVDKSIERPLDFVLDNTVATVNVMEFARAHLQVLALLKC